MKKLHTRQLWAVIGVAVYLALLRLLVFVEAGDPDATITTIADAAWYSLVTLTTAGYGDLYPVTAGGRLVGTLFLLFSTGLLAVLISGAVLLASGRLLPRLRLLLGWRRRWYVFSRLDRESAALARNLSLEQPKALLIFCGGRSAAGPPVRHDWLLADAAPEEVLRWRRKGGCTLLVLGPDSLANLELAQKNAGSGIEVCCQSDIALPHLPQNITLFDRWESCARLYWQEHPLTRAERQVVLCGAGRYAAALLEQALLSNIFEAEHQVTYHLFGGWGDFLRDHPGLGEAVDVDADQGERDRLVFHWEGWDDRPEVLAGADRIILCAGTDEEDLDMLRRIRRYVPTPAAVHLRLSRALEGETVFGADQELFTPELVLRTRLDLAARAMHEIYRQSAGGQAPAWEELSDFTRRSNLAAADHLLTKVRFLLEDDSITRLTADCCRAAFRRWQEGYDLLAGVFQEMEHRRWCRFYYLNGWTYAPKRDNALRRHPDLRPFHRLTAEEQAKDDYAWALLGAMADRLEAAEKEENKL